MEKLGKCPIRNEFIDQQWNFSLQATAQNFNQISMVNLWKNDHLIDKLSEIPFIKNFGFL